LAIGSRQKDLPTANCFLFFQKNIEKRYRRLIKIPSLGAASRYEKPIQFKNLVNCELIQ